MISMVLLLADASPDPLVAAAAALAILCGVVLLGGRSVVGLPLRIIRSLKPREMGPEPIVIALPSPGDCDQEPDSPMRRLVA
jgi:hypothetical protein